MKPDHQFRLMIDCYLEVRTQIILTLDRSFSLCDQTQEAKRYHEERRARMKL